MHFQSQNTTNSSSTFGSVMPERVWSDENRNYRFGFNGYERQDELYGEGNGVDFGERIYDSRLGRFLSVDPLMFEFPYQSLYIFAANAPILFIDLDGESAENPNENKDIQKVESIDNKNKITEHSISNDRYVKNENFKSEIKSSQINSTPNSPSKVKDSYFEFKVTPTNTGYSINNTGNQINYYNSIVAQFRRLNPRRYIIVFTQTEGINRNNVLTQLSADINHPSPGGIVQLNNFYPQLSKPSQNSAERIRIYIHSIRLFNLQTIYDSIRPNTNTPRGMKTHTLQSRWVLFRMNLARKQLDRVNNRIHNRAINQ